MRILEIGGIGPVPFAGMLFADMGADVLRIDRVNTGRDFFPGTYDVTRRGRPCISLDLKDDAGREAVLALTAQADGLIEGYRPGVMERLGLAPSDVHARNPRLVFGRMTGYGQEGPNAHAAGHDINYIAMAGALAMFSRYGERPIAPLNLVGDYGGGALFLAFGVLCALFEARTSGVGQVVDAAMVDGVALLLAQFHSLHAAGMWDESQGKNFLDTGAPFYDVYETADGRHMAVGAMEPQFYERVLELLEIPASEAPQWDRSRWPGLQQRFADAFRSRTQEEWSSAFEHEDACVIAVTTFADAPHHPHMAARGTFVEVDGLLQPGVAPRLSRTPGTARAVERDPGPTLDRWGVDDQVRELIDAAAAPAPTLRARD